MRREIGKREIVERKIRKTALLRYARFAIVVRSVKYREITTFEIRENGLIRSLRQHSHKLLTGLVAHFDRVALSLHQQPGILAS